MIDRTAKYALILICEDSGWFILLAYANDDQQLNELDKWAAANPPRPATYRMIGTFGEQDDALPRA